MRVEGYQLLHSHRPAGSFDIIHGCFCAPQAGAVSRCGLKTGHGRTAVVEYDNGDIGTRRDRDSVYLEVILNLEKIMKNQPIYLSPKLFAAYKK